MMSAMVHAAVGGVVTALFGLLLAEWTTDVRGASLALVGVLGGLITWLVRVQDDRDVRRSIELKRLKKRQKSVVDAELHVPKPFSQRLARYSGRSEDELAKSGERPRSNMPFWSLVDFRSRYGPKPAMQIRFFLERIRDAVHGISGQR